MAENAPDPKPIQAKSFWSTLPGLLTGIGGLVAAIATLLTALVSAGVIGSAKPSPTPSPTVPSTFTATAAPSPSAPPAPAQSADATATPTVTPVPATATVQPGGVLFEDDFSTERNGWLVKVEPEVEKGYEAGEYRITVFQPDFSSWTYPQPPLKLRDFALEVDAHLVGGSASDEFGVLVRYQDATDDFYTFVISSDGTFRIQSYVDDAWADLVKWTKSTAILGDEKVNRLRIVCQGDEMRFFANGILLAQVKDATLGAGNIGLLASAFDKGSVTVAFDNLRVRALTGQ